MIDNLALGAMFFGTRADERQAFEILDRTGTTRNQVVLAWLTGGFPAVTPIVGISTVTQLEEAVAGVSLKLTTNHRERLNSAA